MIRLLTALALLLPATPTLAKDPILSPPIDCALDETCYIQNYVDTDPGPGAADFTCGTLSYDGHKGTDFALPALIDMWQGVDVLPAAPGTVLATRDGMEDFPQGTEGAPDITGRACGNGVVVDHGDGWSTQYCHMMQGSISVQEGQKVTKTTALGQVGLSGQTEFPHVHMTVRHNGKVIDPFNPGGVIACGMDAIMGGTLWDRDMVYHAGGLLAVGIDTKVPDYDSVKAGTAGADALNTQSPALVVYAYGYGALPGDIFRMSIFGPEGEVIGRDIEIDKAQAQLYRAIGRKTPGAWPVGGYSATVQLIRKGQQIGKLEERFQILE